MINCGGKRLRADSKSAAGDSVGVRVPPPAPKEDTTVVVSSFLGYSGIVPVWETFQEKKKVTKTS